MARQKPPEGEKRRRKPATSPEGREQQLVSYAYDLVEERILNGTASSQETTHFLKLGSSRERLEQARLEKDVELMEAKKQNIADQQRSEERFHEAIQAMRSYQGEPPQVEDGPHAD